MRFLSFFQKENLLKDLMKKTLSVETLQANLREFVKKRNWQAYHNPKNLTMALTKEAAELLEIFQWLSEKESKEIINYPEKMQDVKDEMADIFSYLLRLADILEVDLEDALLKKVKKNEAKYPLDAKKTFSL